MQIKKRACIYLHNENTGYNEPVNHAPFLVVTAKDFPGACSSL